MVPRNSCFVIFSILMQTVLRARSEAEILLWAHKSERVPVPPTTTRPRNLVQGGGILDIMHGRVGWDTHYYAWP